MNNPWLNTLPAERLAQVIEEKGNALKARHHTDDAYFAYWLHVLDANVRRRIALSYDDLEDWMYWDAYDAGMSPRDAAIQMLEDNGWAGAYES